MSLSFDLEADENLTRAEVIKALKACNVTTLIEDDGEIRGNFPRSEMFFFLRRRIDEHDLLAEGLPSSITWKVGIRMSFDFVTDKYDECKAELITFLGHLAALTASHFVLSFQYEVIHAIRDEKGLKILNF